MNHCSKFKVHTFIHFWEVVNSQWVVFARNIYILYIDVYLFLFNFAFSSIYLSSTTRSWPSININFSHSSPILELIPYVTSYNLKPTLFRSFVWHFPTFLPHARSQYSHCHSFLSFQNMPKPYQSFLSQFVYNFNHSILLYYFLCTHFLFC